MSKRVFDKIRAGLDEAGAYLKGTADTRRFRVHVPETIDVKIAVLSDATDAKDPDELIEDTREFVRRSPGVAIAGAAIVGFALARLIKSGLDSSRDEDDEDERA